MLIQINRSTCSLLITFDDTLYVEYSRQSIGGPSSAAQEFLDVAHSVDWEIKDHLSDATCTLWFNNHEQVFTLKPVGAGRIIVKWPDDLEISGYVQDVQMFIKSFERILIDWYYNKL